jgi:predicted MPP superfamily phosphohydrolase
VHLTDLHVNPWLPMEYYRQVFAVAQEAQADFGFVTGDLVPRAACVPLLPSVLQPIGRLGTFAVLGNHDFWAGQDDVCAALRAAGMTVLANETRQATIDGVALQIAGYDYPWGDAPRHMQFPPKPGIRLLLSHTPDNIYRIPAGAADCVFAGHCHAGQFRLPLIGPMIVPSVYGRRFDHGHFLVRGMHLFVASGVGGSTHRLYCQPDIFVVDVTPASLPGG